MIQHMYKKKNEKMSPIKLSYTYQKSMVIELG